jgi:hypothetical protein
MLCSAAGGDYQEKGYIFYTRRMAHRKTEVKRKMMGKKYGGFRSKV